jgi:hypothetical protein
MSIFRSRRFQEIVGGALVLAVFVLPVFVWAGNTKKVYVDASVTGVQDGSINHPYKTITEALDRVNDDDKVYVAAGVYEENIEIPYSVKVFGADEDTTIIKAADKDKPAVIMHNKTTLDKFTVKGGNHGVYVSRWSSADIIHCIVRDSEKDGIHVRNANIADKFTVSIVKSEIKNNDRAGIFSEKHKLVITETEVHDNGSDGADIATGSKAWIDDNTFRDNDGSGLKVSLDNSSIFVASKNTFRDNNHEGIEVNAYGQAGTVSVKKSKFINNQKYGIARIDRSANVSINVWKGLTETDNTFTSNNRGNVSPVLHIQ